jgi:hypothetical protein
MRADFPDDDIPVKAVAVFFGANIVRGTRSV